MRYFLIAVLLLFSFCSFSQSIVYRSNNTVTVLDYNLFSGNSFRLPVYNDTVQANSAYTLDSCGKMIFTRNGNKLYYRACGPKRWLEIVSPSIPSSFIDSLKKSNDSIFARKNNQFVFQYKDSVGGGMPQATASGTDLYTATIGGVSSYVNGASYLIRFTNGNTSGCSLNINGLGAKTLYRNNDGVLIGGDIISGAEMLCIYNSTLNGFQTIGVAPNTLIGYVTNGEAIAITKGKPVYAFSGTGDRMVVKLANNKGDSASAQTVGIVLSPSIGANQKGFIMMQGLLDGLSILPTSTWSDGDAVYLDSIPGGITKIKPSAPYHLVYLGVVTTASNGASGRMYVRVQNGYELSELHDVSITNPANNQILAYSDTVPKLWKNRNITSILDTAAMLANYQRMSPFPIANFGGGSGAAADTTVFTNTAIYGSFYNSGGDTIIVTGYTAVCQGTSPSITPTIYFNDSLNVTAGATKIVNSPAAVTSTTTGNTVTSLNNTKIPPGNFVWVVSETVTTKPRYFSLTLIGYRKRP